MAPKTTPTGLSKMGSSRVRKVETSNAAKAATTLPEFPVRYGVVGMAKAHIRKAKVEASAFHQGHFHIEGNAGSPELLLFPANIIINKIGVSAPKTQYTLTSVTILNVCLSAGIADDAAT